MLAVITRLFPLWALLLSLIAYYTPSTFTPVGPWVATLLMLIMFGMGVILTLTTLNACSPDQPLSPQGYSCTIW